MTKDSDSSGSETIDRLPSGISGLDAILQGGFLQGGIYIVRGMPGAGKTILGSQVCFHYVASGKRALYVTMLSESHARMLQHLRSMAFFDPKAIPASLYYVSAFSVLEGDGLSGLLDLLRREIRGHGATLLILDGLVALHETVQSSRELKKFIHELQAHVALEACTALLLTSDSAGGYSPEHTMVDGLIELYNDPVGARAERELEVRKLRGSDFLGGRHSFKISSAGITVYPRTEALLARPSIDSIEIVPSTERRRMGIALLDAMLDGGLPSGTTTLILGAGGAGKTSLGLQFLGASSKAEPGLILSFYEPPRRLAIKAGRLGVKFDELIEKGHLEVLWQPPTEELLDAVGDRLLEAVRRRNVRRLVIDGVAGFQQIASRPERLSRFLAALANELRTRDVTAIYTAETQTLFGPTIETPMPATPAIVDNLVLLRFVELRATLHRLISILKVRDSDFDSSLREFKITNTGIELADTFRSAQEVLSGFAHIAAKDRPQDVEPRDEGTERR